MYISLFFLLIILLFLVAFIQIKWAYGYWRRRKIPHIKGKFPFGILKNSKPGQRFNQYFDTLYAEMKDHKCFGIYFFTKPLLVLRDLDLIKEVFIKDFDHFNSRGIYLNKKDDSYTSHLVNLEGADWYRARHKFTSVMSAGRLRSLFNLCAECSHRLVDNIKEDIIKNDGIIEGKYEMQNYTINTIGILILGLDFSDFREETSPFRSNLLKMCQRNSLKELVLENYPEISRALGMKRIRSESTEFFKTLIENTIKFRQNSNIRRNDVLQGMLDALNQDSKSFTTHDIIVFSYMFIRGGYDTTYSFLTWALFHLANNPDIQEKLRKHLVVNLEKNDQKITHDWIQSLSYLNQVVNESLRMNPPLPIVSRKCLVNHKFTEIDLGIPKGMQILVPIESIQNDPKYFPNPKKFDPERFNEYNKQKIIPMTFMPFGNGPRICVANRYALLVGKMALVTFVLNFRFSLHSKNKLPLPVDLESKFFAPDKLWLNIETI